MKINSLSLLILLGFTASSHAACVRVTNNSQLSSEALNRGYTATTWRGACDTCNGPSGLPPIVSISSGTNFQPSGTLLASGVSDFLNGASAIPYTANQILYRCDLADADSLYEMYSTNGDNDRAGKQATDEVEGAYFDYVRNVATRLTNLSDGQYYSRYWKERKLTADTWFQDGQYIYIPANAFSNILYEVFKIDDTRYSVNNSANYSDNYSQPRGYILFKGPGLNTANLQAGADHNSNYPGHYANWPGAWGTYRNVTWVRGALCKVTDYPAVVTLPRATPEGLRSGEKYETPFSITLECENGAKSYQLGATNSGAVAIGFLPPQSAISTAQQLGLPLSPSNILTWLLDSNYGSKGVASGVGIRLYNRWGYRLNFLQSTASAQPYTDMGWLGYEFSFVPVAQSSTELWRGDFTASLERLPGYNPTPGTVNAQLQVVISFQ